MDTKTNLSNLGLVSGSSSPADPSVSKPYNVIAAGVLLQGMSRGNTDRFI